MENIVWLIIGIAIVFFVFRKKPSDLGENEFFKRKTTHTGLFGMLFDSFYRIFPWWVWRIWELFFALIIIYACLKVLLS